MSPDPIVIPWRGRQLCVRHDDPKLTAYSPGVSRLRSAVGVASDVEGLRLVLASVLSERYRVRSSAGEFGAWHYSGDGPSCPFRSRARGTIVIPTHYVSGDMADMVASIGSRPFVVHEVTRAPMGAARSLLGFELRTVGLSVAANLLRMRIADLDCVRVAAAKADFEPCPVCGPHPRRAG